MPGNSKLIRSPQQSQRSAFEILVSVPEESEYNHMPDSPRPIPVHEEPFHNPMDEQERRMVEEISKPSLMQNKIGPIIFPDMNTK